MKKERQKSIFAFFSRPFFWMGTVLLLTDVVLSLFNFKYSLYLGVGLLAVGIFVLFLKRKRVSAYISFVLIFVSVGCISFSAMFAVCNEDLSGENEKVFCTVTDKKTTDKTQTNYLSVNRCNGKREVKHEVVYYSPLDARVGDEIELENAVLSKRNNTSAFKTVKPIYVLKGFDDISVIVKEHSPMRYVYCFRERIKTSLRDNLPEKFSPVASGILIGDRTGMDDEIAESFSVAGVSHLFAVSGLHLTLWTMMLFALLNSITTISDKTKAVISTLFIIFFAALTLFSVSVIRAGIMLMIVNLSVFVYRKADSLNSLFIAVTVMLIFQPLLVTDASFLLSVFATMNFVLFSKYITKFLSWKMRKIKKERVKNTISSVLSTVILTFGVVVFTFPITLMCFGYFSLYAFLSNLLLLFPGEILMVIVFLALVFSPLSFLSRLFYKIAALLCSYLVFVTEKISHFPFAVSRVGSRLGIALCAVSVFLIIVGLFFFKRKPAMKISCIVLCFSILVGAAVGNRIYTRDDIHVVTSNVGNDLCVMIKRGKTSVMVDLMKTDRRKYSQLFSLCDRRTLSCLVCPENSHTNKFIQNNLNEKYIKNIVGIRKNTSKAFFLDDKTGIDIICTEKIFSVKVTFPDNRSVIVVDGKFDEKINENFRKCDIMVSSGVQPSYNFSVNARQRIFSTSKRNFYKLSTADNGKIETTIKKDKISNEVEYDN